MTIEVGLLGPMVAVHAGVPVDLGSTSRRVVLAALLMADGRVVATDELVDMIWPSDPPRTALSKLQGHVCALRKALRAAGVPDPTRYVVTTAPGYLVPRGAMQTDLAAFVEVVDGARSSAGAGRLDEAAERYGRALDIVRGPALADLGAARTLLAADMLTEQVLAVVEAKAEIDVQRGRAADALEIATRALRAHPFRDRLHELSIHALVELGRPTDAIRSYRRCRDLYRAELGIEPSEAVRRLVDAILSETVMSRAGAVRAAVVTPRPAHPRTELRL
ncbi:BTAD domain-containing putative transcriptional regulator [Cellulomonas sp. URHD0024]|uniref:AfsR/SARP family transcriptional regulator n=1 Tax=Cellulomonas sp. URHD0024 TaxID=1302620 RepID=UPI00041FF68C|nr:BTAD domain-containing putative transcriptional regulator [Cellulomonas sp. URHD0024]